MPNTDLSALDNIFGNEPDNKEAAKQTSKQARQQALLSGLDNIFATPKVEKPKSVFNTKPTQDPFALETIAPKAKDVKFVEPAKPTKLAFTDLKLNTETTTPATTSKQAGTFDPTLMNSVEKVIGAVGEKIKQGRDLAVDIIKTEVLKSPFSIPAVLAPSSEEEATKLAEEAKQEVSPVNKQIERFNKNVSVGVAGTTKSILSGAEWAMPEVFKPVTQNFIDANKAQLENWEKEFAPKDGSFVDALEQGVGSVLTFFIPGVAVARGTAALSTISPRIALLFGNSVSTALEAMSEAGSVYDNIKQGGGSEEDANWSATKTFWANAVLIGITQRYGAFSEKIKGAIKRAIVSAPLEGFQEFVQQIISNTQLGRPAMEGAWESGAIGTILGFPIGFIGGGVEPGITRRLIEEKFGSDLSGGASADLRDDVKLPAVTDAAVQEQIVNQEILNQQANQAGEIIVAPTAQNPVSIQIVSFSDGQFGANVSVDLSESSFSSDIKTGTFPTRELALKDVTQNILQWASQQQPATQEDIQKLQAVVQSVQALAAQKPVAPKKIAKQKIAKDVITPDEQAEIDRVNALTKEERIAEFKALEKRTDFAVGDTVSFHKVKQGVTVGLEPAVFTITNQIRDAGKIKIELTDEKGKTIWTTPAGIERVTKEGKPIGKKTQAEKVKEAVKEKPKTIKQIAAETKLLEPNVRRILGVGAKEGTFTRVEKGVYILSKDGVDTAFIHPGDALEILPKLVEDGFKADMIFLDIPWDAAGNKGGNRFNQKKGTFYDTISVSQFGEAIKSIEKMLRKKDTPVVFFYSQSKSSIKQSEKYIAQLTEAGFKPLAKGDYFKYGKNGKRLTMPLRSDFLPPEAIMIFNKTGKYDFTKEPNLQFHLVRPRGWKTEKAPEMVRELIELTTAEGEMVLDPFAGSGVSGEQAIKTGRKVTLIEKSEEAVEKHIKPRLEKAIKEPRFAKKKASEEFKVGDVFETGDKTNMASPVTIREIAGNTIKFTDAKGVEYAGMARATVRELVKGDSWKKISSNKQGKEIKNIKLFHGENKVVTEHTKSFSNVKVFANDQHDAIAELAPTNSKADEIFGEVNFYIKADNFLRDYYKKLGYDAIEYGNNHLPQKGKEYVEISTGKFFSENKVTAELYAIQDRKGKLAADKPRIIKELGVDEKVFNIPESEARKILLTIFNEKDVNFLTRDSIVYGGRNVVGLYSNALIQLVTKNKKVSENTVYHEAMHQYIDLFLTEEERRQVFREVNMRHWKELGEPYVGYGRQGTPVRLNAEEWLAYAVEQYRTNPKTFTGKILRFLQQLFKRVRNWAGQKTLAQNLFDDFLSGKAITKQRNTTSRFSSATKGRLPLESEKPKIPVGELASLGSQKIGNFEQRTAAETEGIKIYEKVRELIEKYAKRVGQGYLPRNAAGVYYPGTENIRINGMNNLGVAAHEITHFLDKTYKIGEGIQTVTGTTEDGKPIYDSSTKQYRKGLTELYVEYYPGGRSTHSLKKRTAEGLAMLIEKYVEMPTTIEKKYPTLVKDYLKPGGKFYHPIMGEILKDLNQIVAEYQGLKSIDKVSSRIVSDEVNVNSDEFLSFADKVKTEVADNIYPIEKLAKMSGTHFTKKDPSLWLRQYGNLNSLVNNNIAGKLGYWTFKNGEFTKLYDYNWKTLVSRLSAEKQHDSFAAFLVARNEYFLFEELDALIKEAQRLKDLLDTLGDDADIVSADGSSPVNDFKEAMKKVLEAKEILENDGFTRKEVTDAYLENKARFKEEAEMFDTMVRADLDLLHEVGLVTDDSYSQLTSREGYATLKRQFIDDIVGEQPARTQRFGGTKVSSMIRRKGSSRPIINPLFASLKNHTEVMRKSIKQQVYNKIGELAPKFPQIFQKQQLKTVPQTGGGFTFPQEKDPNIIMARPGGKRVPYLVSGIIKTTVDDVLNPTNISLFEQLLLGGSRLFTKGTTGLFPAFAFSNYAVDQATASAQSRNKYIPIYTPLKLLTEAMEGKNSLPAQYFMEYLAMGGERQTLVGWQDMTPNELFQKVAGERRGLLKVVDAVNAGADVLALPAKYSEIATRASEYVKSRIKGNPTIVAFEEAGRVTAPFHHIGRFGGGRATQTYIKSMPFFNPAIQVIAQSAETLNNPKLRNQYLVVGAAITASFVAAVIVVLANGTDEQKELLRDINPDELAKYIWLPHPNGKTLVKVRIPDQFGAIGSLISMAIIQKRHLTKYSPLEYLNATMSWLPQQFDISQPTRAALSWLPQVFKPGVYTLLGVKDWPKVMPLETQAMKNKPAGFRTNETTSPVAKWLGQKFDLSPIKIDYLVTGYLGRAAGFVMGKPGVYNPFQSMNRKYYMTSGRTLQEFYELRDYVDQQYSVGKSGEKKFTTFQKNRILQQRKRINDVEELLSRYRKIDIEKEPDRAARGRREILDKVQKILDYGKP